MFEKSACYVKWRLFGNKSGRTSEHLADHQGIPTPVEKIMIYLGQKCLGMLDSLVAKRSGLRFH